MSDKYLAGIDIGTTGAKVAIFDLKGNIISSAYKEYTCSYPRPNWVEQDPLVLIESTMDACRKAVAKSKINPENISSIGLSSQRSCTIFIDKQGNILRPMISWQDNRANTEVKEIESKISNHDYYNLTGLPNNTTWLLPKILWVRKNEPKIWGKVNKVVQLQDFALKAFGAEEYYNDIPDVAMSGMMDTDKLTWSSKLLSLFDIDKGLLPVPISSGKKIGVISEKVSQKTGFAKGTILCVGAGDQNSAAVGAGIVYNGYMSVSIGTAANVIAYLDKPLRDPKEKNMITSHAIYGKWQLEGYQAGAASIYKWFRDEIAIIEKAYASIYKKDAYEVLNELIKKVPPGSKGLILMPYFASATAPRWNPDARGLIAGLTFAHDRGCIARSFIEGITLGVKDMIVSMLGSGISINTIRILGGPTKSELWNQMQADMYNRKVETLKVTDAAILGAAILAGVGIGTFNSIEEGVLEMVKFDKEYEPIKENTEIYNELYSIYCKMYEALEERKIFSLLAKMQERF